MSCETGHENNKISEITNETGHTLFSCPVSLVISIITLDFKLTSPSIGYYYSEIPQNSILICRVQIHGPKQTRADPGGLGQTRVDPGGPEWTRVDPADPGEPGRTRTDLDGLGQTRPVGSLITQFGIKITLPWGTGAF